MRITLRDPQGKHREIDTFSPEIAGAWLAEWLPIMASDIYMQYWTIQVWASNEDEKAIFGTRAMLRQSATVEGFKRLTNFFRRAYERMEKGEAPHGNSRNGSTGKDDSIQGDSTRTS